MKPAAARREYASLLAAVPADGAAYSRRLDRQKRRVGEISTLNQI
jgi:hypothetical protein